MMFPDEIVPPPCTCGAAHGSPATIARTITTSTPAKNPFVLCYIDQPWAFFTDCPLSAQWGDDWNDAPYEHNAGAPYAEHGKDHIPHQIRRVAYDGPFNTPCSNRGNSQWSVQDINAGKVAWLATDRYHNGPAVVIPAGTEYEEFARLVQLGGGNVYEPRGGRNGCK